MPTVTYQERRSEIETYFDRTAVEAWKRLTSDAPVSRIRATVRAGRDSMRATLLDWLPADLTGKRILDAGCGTGALALEAARRGAYVIAVDLSPNLVNLAHERSAADFGAGHVEFRVGDMLDEDHGEFDHVVAMDSLIHYQPEDVVRVLSVLSARTRQSMLFTFAPRTHALVAMRAVGRLLPQGNRAPSIVPVCEKGLRKRLAAHTRLRNWNPSRTLRINSGFYKSQAMELSR